MKKGSKDEAKGAILGMFRRTERPMLVGIAAVRLGSCWTLDETEALFHELTSDGSIRPITKDERAKYGVQEGYVLTGVGSG